MRDEILGLVRHALTTFGGIIAAKGHIGDSDAELMAGAISTLAGIIWSIVEKRRRKAGIAATTLVLMIGLSLPLTGCPTMLGVQGGEDGERPVITKERCQTFVAIARVAIIDCEAKSDEMDRRRCVAYAEAAIAAAEQWCAGYPSELEGLELPPLPEPEREPIEPPTPPGPPVATVDEFGNWTVPGS